MPDPADILADGDIAPPPPYRTACRPAGWRSDGNTSLSFTKVSNRKLSRASAAFRAPLLPCRVPLQ